jgi:hypothetical protein
VAGGGRHVDMLPRGLDASGPSESLDAAVMAGALAGILTD